MLPLFLSLCCVLAAVLVLVVLLLPLDSTKALLERASRRRLESLRALCVALLLSLGLSLYSVRALLQSGAQEPVDDAALWRMRLEAFSASIAFILFATVGRQVYLLVDYHESVAELQRLREVGRKQGGEQEMLKRIGSSLKEQNRKLQQELDEALQKVASLGAIITQAKNQQKEYMRLMDENTRLIELVGKFENEKEELITQLISKPSRDKKRD